MTINAVEHGELGLTTGRVEVHYTVEDTGSDASPTLLWLEPGSTANAQPDQTGFGMEVLIRMLPYNFQADTTMTYGAEGLCCTICFLRIGALGRVQQAQYR